MTKAWLWGILLVWILLCTFSVMAETNDPGKTLLFNDTVYHTEKVTVEEKTLELTVNPSFQAMIEHNDNTIILTEYRCTSKDGFQYCVENISQDEQGNYFAETALLRLQGALNISRSFDKTKARIGELITATITLTNIGYQDINLITYEEVFPNFTFFHTTNNMTLEAHRGTWKGDLIRGQTKQFAYTIYGGNASTFDQAASISFFNGYNSTYTNSSETEFSFNHSLATVLGSNELEVGESSTINLTFRNPFNKEISVELEIDFPPHLNPTSYVGWTRDGKTLSWSDVLSANKEVNHSITFRAEKTGTDNIVSWIRSLTVDGREVRNNLVVDEVKADFEDLSITTSWGTSADAKEETSKQLAVGIENENNHVPFNQIRFSATMENETLYEKIIDQLPAGEESNIDFSFAVPGVVQSTSKKINLSFAYSTVYGEKKYSSIIRTLNIKADEGISITKTFSNTSFTSNETLNITVSIKNNRGVDLEQVLVEESFSKDFVLLGGLTKKYVPLDAGETLEVYSYLLRVPLLEYDKQYTFETTVMDDLDNHLTTYNNKETVFVAGEKGKRPPEADNLSNQSNTSQNRTLSSRNQTETLINETNQVQNNEADSEQEQGGVRMLVAFYIPLILLIVGIVLFILFLKMGIITLNLPVKQATQAQQTQQAPVQQAPAQAQQPVAQSTPPAPAPEQTEQPAQQPAAEQPQEPQQAPQPEQAPQAPEPQPAEEQPKSGEQQAEQAREATPAEQPAEKPASQEAAQGEQKEEAPKEDAEKSDEQKTEQEKKES